MINIPLEQIRSKISTKTGLSQDEISAKIKEKLKQLSGLISEEGAAHIVANELGVKLFEGVVGENLQIKNVLAGMRNVDLTAKIIQKYDVREFNGPKGPGKVLSMLVGDETGLIRVVLWNKQAENGAELKDGDIIKVVGGYVRENQGRNEVHLNDMAKLIINPRGVEVNVKQRDSVETRAFTRKKISEISENDAAVEVLGTVVQVFDLNFFEVCPKCNKRARLREDGFACQAHGTVTPEYNFVMNIYLDDGSDNVRVVLWREQAEQLLGMKKEQILAFKEDAAQFEALKHELLGNIILVAGKAANNQTFNRIELVAAKITKNPDIAEETSRVKAELAKPVPANTPVSTQAAAHVPAGHVTPQAKPAAPVQQKPAYQTRPAYPAKPIPPDLDEKTGRGEVDEFNLEEELVDIEDL
jgi:ssDNA-binding replication factor A large subunit